MSLEAMKPVWESTLGPTDKLVLLAMADFANKTGGSIFPSVATIAARTSLSRRAVFEAIASFRKRGILIRVAAQPGRPVAYQLDPSKLPGAPAAPPCENRPVETMKRGAPAAPPRCNPGTSTSLNPCATRTQSQIRYLTPREQGNGQPPPAFAQPLPKDGHRRWQEIVSWALAPDERRAELLDPRLEGWERRVLTAVGGLRAIRETRPAFLISLEEKFLKHWRAARAEVEAWIFEGLPPMNAVARRATA